MTDAVEAAFRCEWGRLVAGLIRSFGDWDLAEECAQDAFAKAVERWPVDGVPDRPGAWLTSTARNRAVDVLRRRGVADRALTELVVRADDDAAPGGSGVVDDRLRLIFTCCHPALALDAQVALTLRTMSGLTTEEIARALLVPTPTMGKRLVRAKRKIAEAGIPFAIPEDHALVERTGAMLGVLYLLFNEGYSATKGELLVRPDLAEEAIRLARLLAQLMPDEPEANGLLALMLLQHSRRDARLGEDGELVLLEDQDRRLWDLVAIDEGVGCLAAARRLGRPGPYQVQAAIAEVHATAPSPDATDWHRVVTLYDELVAMTGSPVVALNRAVAVSMADGPAAGLVLVDEIDATGALAGYYLLAATRAHLCRRLGRTEEAAAAYRAALRLVGTEPERRHLEHQLATLR